MRIRTFLAAALLLVLGSVGSAQALDQPVAGQRLVMKRSGAKGKITFAVKDPALPFPAIGGPDDPSVVGALLEILPATVGAGALAVPAGLGKPGWTAKAARVSRYKYSRKVPFPPATVVTSLQLQQGGKLKIVVNGGLVDMPGGIGPVAVRVTVGSLRVCALFGAAAIGKDVAGRFSAAKAPAPAIADCSDASLGIPCAVGGAPACGGACPGDGACTAYAGGCRCVSPSAPCGDTYPTCNGTCGDGDTCIATGGGECACAPPGSLGCGSTAAPTCGGACPTGDVCRPVFGVGPPTGIESFACACGPPLPCAAGGGFDCPAGFGCGVNVGSGGQPGCAAMPCGGAYPTCGGSCGDGGECQAIADGPLHACVCAVPAACDGTCGGLGCPPGEVCSIDDGCGCITP